MISYTRIFIHGLESSSKGNKGRFFRENFPDMIIEDYVGSFDARMEKLNLLILGRRNLILVGSSFGGLMAATYACRNPENVSRLILLAPALNLEEFTGCVASKLKMPAIIFHGRSDDVVPLLPVLKIAEEVFMDLDFHVLDDDHPLSRSFESLGWERLLQ
jgi:pimeloyl-ACP methyl ester carboxylesterase